MRNHPGYFGEIQGAAKCTFALLKKSGRNHYEPIGSASIFTVAGRFFLITAAHVANLLDDSNATVRTASAYIDIHIPFGKTEGREDDKVDIAIGELDPKVLAIAGQEFCKPFDLPDVTQDFIHKPGDQITFSGYPTTSNKKRVLNDKPPAQFMYTGPQIKFDHVIYKGKGFVPHRNMAIDFDRKKCTALNQTKVIFPLPHGMSGGLVWATDRAAYIEKKEVKLTGVIGIGIEYHESDKLLIGTHIGAVFEALRNGRPDLRKHIPKLIPDGRYYFGG